MKTLQEISNEITRQHRKVRYYKDLHLIGAIDSHFCNNRIKKANLRAEELQLQFDELYINNNK